MAKYKLRTDIPLMGSDVVLKKGDIVEGIAMPTGGAGGQKSLSYSYKTKNGATGRTGLIVGTQIEEIVETNGGGNQLTEKQAGEVIGFFDSFPAAIKRIQVLATLGVVGGGVLAYRRGSGVGGWLGWTFLGSLAGTLVAIGSVKFFPPKEGLISDAVKDAIKNPPIKTGNTGINGGKSQGKPSLSKKDRVLKMFAEMEKNPPKSEAEAIAMAKRWGLTKADVEEVNIQLAKDMEAGISAGLGGQQPTNVEDVAQVSETGADGWKS